MKTRFHFPTRIVFGPGVIQELAALLGELGVRRPLVVTDQGLTKTDIPGRILSLLSAGGLDAALFGKVEPNPTDEQVELGASSFEEHGADCIVAVGGGSPMDAGKATQLRIHHKEPLEVYDDLKGGDSEITGVLPPLIAVPTTAGTGSEVSRSAVITIAAEERKMVLFSPRLMPAFAVCDPELTYDLPAQITAETGMDALSHNLEAFLSTGYHPMADAIALAGIRMVTKYLPEAVRCGRSVQARQEMMMASSMGAVAFQKGLGVIHSLAHPLSSLAGMGHGLANAIMMPHAVRYNGEKESDRVKQVAMALGAKEISVDGAASAVEELITRIGLPSKLGQAGVERTLLPKLADKAMQDGCHANNPRACSLENMQALFEAAM